VLGGDGDVPLPDGTTFAAVLSEARTDLDEASTFMPSISAISAGY